MITDPKTVPEGRATRRAFGAAIGLLAVLLIAPQTTEFATKVAVLAALALVCAARPLIGSCGPPERTGPAVDRTACAAPGRRERGRGRGSRSSRGRGDGSGRRGRARGRAEPGRRRRARLGPSGELPEVRILPSEGVATQLDRAAPREQIVLATLASARAFRPARSTRADVTLEPGEGQGPPLAVATLFGSNRCASSARSSSRSRRRASRCCASGTRRP